MRYCCFTRASLVHLTRRRGRAETCRAVCGQNAPGTREATKEDKWGTRPSLQGNILFTTSFTRAPVQARFTPSILFCL